MEDEAARIIERTMYQDFPIPSDEKPYEYQPRELMSDFAPAAGNAFVEVFDPTRGQTTDELIEEACEDLVGAPPPPEEAIGRNNLYC
jgi:hypothetical protein